MTQYQEICAALAQQDVPYDTDVSLARYTTFKIGGPAAVFCSPQTQGQLAAVLSLCQAQGARRYLLGKGSNILFSDQGFDGVVIHIGEALSAIAVCTETHTLTAQAGASLAHVCTAAQQAGLAGLEFAFGIPGCVGGAVYMNAGAYGGEMKDVLQSVTYLDEAGAVHTRSAKDLELGYRTSIFEHTPWCVLSATFALTPDDAHAVHTRMTEYARRRADKQPLDMPSAGSTFKRPEGAFAGALIDTCGLRGFSVGGAAISTKHCGFVVNTGGATCADVLALADEVCKIVQQKTGFVLEKEVRVVE